MTDCCLFESGYLLALLAGDWWLLAYIWTVQGLMDEVLSITTYTCMQLYISFVDVATHPDTNVLLIDNQTPV